MAKVSYKTEDQVRDGAKITLGFDKFSRAPSKSQHLINLVSKDLLTNRTVGISLMT